jgi:hypothetical protein
MSCNNWFKNEMQLELHNNLIKISQKELRIYLLQNVKKINDKNKWEFYLNNRLVCPKLFANTIGHKNLVSIKRFFITQGIDNRYRNRNKWKQHSNEFNNKIKNFLLSFEPNYSHYSLKSTPNRLFIPSIYAMNSIKLYKEFCGRNGFLLKIHKTLNTNLKRDVKRTEEELEFCNFEYFEKMRKKLNIHFEKVTNDLCSTCTEHSLHHNKQYNEEFCSCVCDLCKKFNIDLKNAKNSRIQMRKKLKVVIILMKTFIYRQICRKQCFSRLLKLKTIISMKNLHFITKLSANWGKKVMHFVIYHLMEKSEKVRMNSLIIT